MDVIIEEAATQKLVTIVPVVLGGANYVPTSDEYLNAAWQAAVEDELVDPA